jgi:hypothetical protein
MLHYGALETLWGCPDLMVISRLYGDLQTVRVLWRFYGDIQKLYGDL